ncbi:deoxynucleoside triphosphate triphosphohydrolase SAMHD1-like protein [Labeo rohita]|uniref:Deoxynucleoside triphosphate triphosphohydrolase SAMHD1-like protein n=1 Tax=Labeo rohita TaxID=84645 RepID=A0A498L8F3_LABRO|nr:deoxynucleoside triphosphate triphosphohydrolase SAMHD1-like protein [Labeo rohita]
MLWETVKDKSSDDLKKCSLDFPNEHMKIFNDPIHGHIELHPLLVKIIDTPQFQRLRHIKQLGGKYLVYPGASHNRFEHSLGSLVCVTTWHEQMSVKMFKHIVETLKKKNKDVLKEHGLNDKDVLFIEELIEGASTKGRGEDKSFLYEIVANKLNGIDVDKWDYFARDCHHLGIQNSFDHLRLMKFARVCKVKDKMNDNCWRYHICFRDKEADNINEMFRTRYTLHRQAYQHKIGNIIEIQFSKALIEADRDLHKDKPEDMFTISAAIKNVAEYTKLTDGIFEQILSSSSPYLKNAQNTLNRIFLSRELPKFVGEARIMEENKYKKMLEKLNKTWKEAVEKYNGTNPAVPLNADHFSIYVVDLDHGMKGKKTFSNIYFYSKRDNKNASCIEDYQVSSLLPDNFSEELVRVYCDTTDGKVVEEAEKCFKEWCKSNFGLTCNIIFYEDKFFQGNHYKCSCDHPNLNVSQLKCCSSIYVESGTWLLYEKSDYTGVKYVLTRGEYPNFQLWKDPKDLCSVKMHSDTSSKFEIHLYEKEEFEDPVYETTVDCLSVESKFGIKEVRSCRVINGVWKLYEGCDYAEPSYPLQEGEYRNPTSWGANNPAKSFKLE